jgi:hypothetical protein
MSKLVEWETPFGSAAWPSVWVVTAPLLKNSVVFVKADSLFKIEFQNILGLRVGDESYDDNTRFHIEGNHGGCCSYIWRDSPWFSEFNVEHAQIVEGGTVNHYVLLGGDLNIEILAIGKVAISLAER